MYIIRPPPMSTRLAKGLSARIFSQRASERNKSQQFHDDVFHGCSPFGFNSPSKLRGHLRLRHINSPGALSMYDLADRRRGMAGPAEADEPAVGVVEIVETVEEV